jgi:protein-L-isoaspartate(D-aspartate) O-methyltransferase
MNYPSSLVQPLQQQLVTDLEHLGAIRSPAVREAFCAIPRHRFLPHYYEQQGNTFHWQKRSAPPPEVDPTSVCAWLKTIYTNRARTTLLDEEQLPISSSSQPSIMAHMLEALQVEPVMRVLEIGTGTGYNSALLSHLTGASMLVTTIDINSSLVKQAREALDEVVGPGIVACVGDGYQGVLEGAPYDRIIATARTATIPDAWYEQLAPDGKLVMDLGGQLTGGLLVAEKAVSGSMQGSFFPLNINFMSMQSPLLPSSRSFRGLAKLAPQQEYIVEAEEFSPLLFQERDFRFFLQWRFPGAALEWWGKDHTALLPAFFDQEKETLLMFANDSSASRWTVQVRGPAPLWQQVLQAFWDWQRLGRPGPSEYQLSIESTGLSYQKRLLVLPKEDWFLAALMAHFSLT